MAGGWETTAEQGLEDRRTGWAAWREGGGRKWVSWHLPLPSHHPPRDICNAWQLDINWQPNHYMVHHCSIAAKLMGKIEIQLPDPNIIMIMLCFAQVQHEAIGKENCWATTSQERNRLYHWKENYMKIFIRNLGNAFPFITRIWDVKEYKIGNF